MSTRPRPTPRLAAFTLTELIVVMTIILILLAVSIPTFRSTMASTESSNAETKLRIALLAGRDAALHSDRGADTAVAFFYEPGGRTYAVVCEYVGTIPDLTDRNPADPAYRDVFVPIPTFEPIQLPPGYMVRGFVPAGMIDVGNLGAAGAWYEGNRYDSDERNWVFPENAFFQARDRDDGRDRQSFMIRFVGGIGSVALGDTREALVLDPRATAAGRTQKPWSDFRVDTTSDARPVVRRAITRFTNQWPFGPSALTMLFGDQSGDTVLCRNVEQLVLYKEAELAARLGQRLDSDTGCFYQNKPDPKFINRLNRTALTELRRWLEGDTNLDGQWLVDNPTDPDEPVARIYTVSRYSAALQPVPLLNLEEISQSRPGGTP